MSINRRAAEVVAHNAGFITFDQTNTGGVIGDATPDQNSQGLFEPNVQAAIDDLWDKALIPVGSVVTTVSSNNPNVIPTVLRSQTVKMTITGTPTSAGNIFVGTGTVAITLTDTPDTVASKVATELASQYGVTSAVAAGNVVTYVYADTEEHPLNLQNQLGLTLTETVTQYPGTTGYFGFGSWEYIGTETKFTKALYYWVRVS